MSASLYLDLQWLPRAPDNFAQRCHALSKDRDGFGKKAMDLASHALDEQQLNRLARIISEAIASGAPLAPLVPLKLGLICNGTTDLTQSALIATAARFGFALTCVASGYNQVLQDALSETSTINATKPDVVLLGLDHRALPMKSAPGNAEASAQMVEASLHYIDAVRGGIHENSGATCIVQTLARTPEALFGSLDYRVPGTWRTLTEQFNRRLADSLAGSGDLLLDVAGLAETVGLASWHDPTLWNLAKVPISGEALPLYADHVCRLLAAWRGKSRRCLVLDLDNTVWGGVVGDDGLENLRIAEGDAVGEAHRAVQLTALDLRERGIVLAVSSKNEDNVARGPFRSHPEMVLREDHIAVFQANWQDKATNIQAIAAELALGVESMVFLDDNPVERGLVRSVLPSVGIPELPDDPALFARTLLASGYLEATTFSDEDRARADFYQSNARRLALQNSAGDISAYLKSLEMEITFQSFDVAGRARIAQLINKSNQFNLTTRRYSEADVAAAETDPNCLTLQVRLKDVFADNGMICVIIARRCGSDLEIDTWLMSCRVLGRKVETAVLQKICAHARAIGARNIIGVYRPTSRNQMVADHYARFGFSLVASEPDGTTTWRLDPSAGPAETVPMRVNDLTSVAAFSS